MQKHMMGGGVCHACGGEIDHDGLAKHMAMGGEVEPMVDMSGEGFEDEEREPVEDAETEQHQSTVGMRDMGFVDAIRNRFAMGGYAGGGMAKNEDPEPVSMAVDDRAEEMKRMKKSRYGFGGR